VKGLKFRFSKTLVLIMGGIVVLGGGSGTAAVIIGTDKILGPSYREINGLECTALETIKIRRDQRYWIRKYVTSDQFGDGVARIKTALRVARAVQEKEKADLVQVAMIDKAGPKDRARMRGRMIGAQVVYIPDLKKVPEGADAETYSAYYLDGSPNSNGEYYGMRIDLPLEDVEALTASLTDKADCIDPAAVAPAGEHGAPTGGHGEKAGGGGHGEAGGHGETSDGHGAPTEGHGEGGEAAAAESGGLLDSITGMIFGSGQEAPAEGQTGEGNAHAVAPAEAHDAPADEHGEAAGEDHGDQSAPPAVTKAEGHDSQPAGHIESTAAQSKERESFFASVKNMLFGSGEDEKAETSHDEASANARSVPEASLPAPEPGTAAEGGKKWSKGTEADEIRSGHDSAEAAHADAASSPAGDANDADAAGAAWLAKLRGETAPAAAKASGEASGTGKKDVH